MPDLWNTYLQKKIIRRMPLVIQCDCLIFLLFGLYMLLSYRHPTCKGYPYLLRIRLLDSYLIGRYYVYFGNIRVYY